MPTEQEPPFHNPPTREYIKFLLIDVSVVLAVVLVVVAGTLLLLTLFGVAK